MRLAPVKAIRIGTLALMSFITWDQYNSAAYGAGTAIGDLMRGAGKFYCDAIRQYPNWSLSNPLGLDPVSRGINDQLCGGEPALPLPDQPAVPGGRCFCARYRVFYEVDPDNAPPFTESYTTRGAVSVLGWQSGIVPGTYAYTVLSQNDACNEIVRVNLVGNISQAAINNGYRVKVTNIVRLDGSEDNCGGQVPRYAPVQPPASFLERNVNINLAPNIPVNIPVIFVRPDIDFTLSPNVNISLQPQFNFPDLGINIGFDLGGVNITNNILSPSINVGVPGDPRPNPPRLPDNRAKDPDLSELYRRLRDIRDELDVIEECACKPDEVLTPVSLGSGRSGTFALPQKTRFVVLQITQDALKPKDQQGLNAPTVLYAGWAWYRNVLSGMGDRQPVDARNKFYPTPERANAFCFTLYEGYLATAIAYRAA